MCQARDCAITDRLHAHHHAYEKPLEVCWLCLAPHRRGHRADRICETRYFHSLEPRVCTIDVPSGVRQPLRFGVAADDETPGRRCMRCAASGEGASVPVGLQGPYPHDCIYSKFAVVIAIAFGIGAITWRMTLLMPGHALAVTFLLMGLGGAAVS
jgi:hypothetical protein